MYYKWAPQFLLNLQIDIFTKKTYLELDNFDLDKNTLEYNLNKLNIAICDFKIAIIGKIIRLIIKIFYKK